MTSVWRKNRQKRQLVRSFEKHFGEIYSKALKKSTRREIDALIDVAFTEAYNEIIGYDDPPDSIRDLYGDCFFRVYTSNLKLKDKWKKLAAN